MLQVKVLLNRLMLIVIMEFGKEDRILGSEMNFCNVLIVVVEIQFEMFEGKEFVIEWNFWN